MRYPVGPSADPCLLKRKERGEDGTIDFGEDLIREEYNSTFKICLAVICW